MKMYYSLRGAAGKEPSVVIPQPICNRSGIKSSSRCLPGMVSGQGTGRTVTMGQEKQQAWLSGSRWIAGEQSLSPPFPHIV